MRYILRIWKGDASGNPAHTQDLEGEPPQIGELAEQRVTELGFDPDKDDYTLAEHEVHPTGRHRV